MTELFRVVLLARTGEGLPNGNEDFVLTRIGEGVRIDIGRHITCFDGLEIDEDLFRIDPADVHLASVRTKQGIVSPVLTWGRRSLWPAPIRLFGRRTGGDGQTSDLFRPWSGLGRYGSLVPLGVGR